MFEEEVLIKADPELADIIPEYIERRKLDIAAVKAMLDKDDFMSIRTIGHQMKGSGGGYGFDDISEIGLELQTAAEKSDPEKINKALFKLEDYLRRVKVIYE